MAGWHLAFRIADRTFALAGEDPALEPFAAALFGAARGEDSPSALPGSRQTGAPFFLRRDQGRFSLWREGRCLCAAETLSAFFREAEWVLAEACLTALDHFYQIHAGVVTLENAAWILAGPPEAGKTSLTLGLAGEGASLFSDEVALIDPVSLQVYPFPRDLVIHPGTERLFPELMARVSAPPWKTFSDCRFVSLVELGWPLPVRPVPCGRLVFPVFAPDSQLCCRPLGQAEAARRLLAQSFDLARWGRRGIEIIGRLVETCPAVELSFADARRAAAALVALAPPSPVCR